MGHIGGWFATPAALDVANNLVEQNPGSSAAWQQRGMIQTANKDYAGSLQSSERAIELDPDNQYAYNDAAVSSMLLGRRAQANQFAKKALELDSSLDAAKKIQKLTDRDGVQTAAPANLGSFDGKDDGTLGASAGGVAARGGLTGGADNDAKMKAALGAAHGSGSPSKGQAVKPESVEHSRAAAAAFMAGDNQKALDEAEKAIAADPANAQAYSTLALAKNRLGRFDEAIQDASRAIMIDPDNAEAFGARAWARYKKDQLRGALSDADRAKANRDNGLDYLTKGLSYEKLGNIEYMMADLEAAAALNPAEFNLVLERARAKYADPANPDASIDLEPDDFSPFAMVQGSPTALAAGGLGAIKWAALAVIMLGMVFGGGMLGRAAVRQRDVATVAAGPAPANVAAVAPPKIAGKYRKLEEIGRGGMGVVYKAVDDSLERLVALKKMREEVTLTSRDRNEFMREARLVAALKHPNIVSIHETVNHNDNLYLVFEFVDGPTLSGMIGDKGRFSVSEAFNLLEPAALAVAHAHSHGVVHRDLKPSNIMVSSLGDVKVMDFGIARQAKTSVSRLTQTAIIGTPAYMAPEQQAGKVSKASDVYALGVTLYQMLTGELPFDGPDAFHAKMKGQYRKPSAAVPELSSEIDGVVARALAPDPAERTPSCEAFLEELRRCATHSS